MTQLLSRLLVGIGLLALLADPLLANQNQPQPFAGYWPRAWRSDEQFKKDLGLTADQVARIDRIHQDALPELRQEWEELNRLDGKLTRLIETTADEAQLARAIDRVETARANLGKTRMLMLARMRLVLTPEQRARLKKRWEDEARQQESTQDQSRQDRTPAPPAVANRPGQ